MLQCIIFWLRGREKGHLISLLATAALAQVDFFGREGEGIFMGAAENAHLRETSGAS